MPDSAISNPSTLTSSSRTPTFSATSHGRPRPPPLVALEQSRPINTVKQGRRHILYLAPDQTAQAKLQEVSHDAGAELVARWGGWHVTVARTELLDTAAAQRALVAAAAGSGIGSHPWNLGNQRYSLNRHYRGVPVPSCIAGWASHDKGVWIFSKEIRRAAERVKFAGWERVEVADYSVCLGPRADVPPAVVEEMVACLKACNWVWVLAVETEANSGMFKFEWDSALLAFV